MRIQTKLFLASLCASALLVGIMFALMQWSVDRGMLSYVNQRQVEQLQGTVDRLADYYRSNGSWEGLHDGRQFDRVASGRSYDRQDRPSGGRHGRGDKGPESGRRDDRRPPPDMDISNPKALHLLDAEKNLVKGHQVEKDDIEIPIIVDDSVAGWLTLRRRESITDGFELQFLQQQRETLVGISLLVFIASALLAIPLARHLVSPIRDLEHGTTQLAGGQYKVSLNEGRGDELGQLAKNFNSLARTLEATEDARRRWFADVSHELRTPLAILKGEIEAMLDGIRPLHIDRIRSLNEEINHLTRLVDDLYELSNSDIGALKYRMEWLDFSELLTAVLDSHEALLAQEQRLLVRPSIGVPEIPLWGDGVRLRQLLENILSNSLKYSEEKSAIHVDVSIDEQQVEVTIDDGPPGVSDEQLAQLFDHLYRTEISRNRATGGSGLGLAICKRIVEGHGGSIVAEHSPLGGVKIRFQLPLLV